MSVCADGRLAQWVGKDKTSLSDFVEHYKSFPAVMVNFLKEGGEKC